MLTQSLEQSPKDRRGGQVSYLLLGRAGELLSDRLAVTWVEGPPGSEQPTHEHERGEQAYVIVRGKGLMKVGDERQEVGAGRSSTSRREVDTRFAPSVMSHSCTSLRQRHPSRSAQGVGASNEDGLVASRVEMTWGVPRRASLHPRSLAPANRLASSALDRGYPASQNLGTSRTGPRR
jgi:hypothetical protein